MPNVRERRQAADRSELLEIIERLGQPRVEKMLGVHRTTIGRWLDGSVTIQQSRMIALRLAAEGRVPGMAGEWDGWYFEDGLLCSPEGHKFEPGEVRSLFYKNPLIKSLWQRIDALERQLVKMTEAAAVVDTAANDLAIWPADVRSKAFGG